MAYLDILTGRGTQTWEHARLTKRKRRTRLQVLLLNIMQRGSCMVRGGATNTRDQGRGGLTFLDGY